MSEFLAARIYDDNYEKNDFDRTIIVKTKDRLDRNVANFINDLRGFAENNFDHKMYEPKLTF